MRNNDQRSSLFWLIIGLGIVIRSPKYGLGTLSTPGAGLFPFLSGLVIVVFSIIVFIQQFHKTDSEDFLSIWNNANWQAMLKVFLALIIYALSVNTLGFILSTFLFVSYLFRMFKTMGWNKAIGGGVLTTIGAYAIFQLWLKAQLPIGIIGY